MSVVDLTTRQVDRLRAPLRHLLEKRHRRIALWWMFGLTGLLLSSVVRGKMDNLGFPTHNVSVIEEHLFGTLPTLWLQSHLFAGSPQSLEWASFMVHSSWFVVPFLAGLLVTLVRPNKTASFFQWFVATLFLVQPLFALFPVEPPWMAHADVIRINALHMGGNIPDSNPLAAMPSLHVALPVALGLWFFKEKWPLPGGLMLAYAGLVSLEVVFSGEHYAIDVLGGVAAAALVALLARGNLVSTVGRTLQRVARTLGGSGQREPVPVLVRVMRRERAQALIEFAFVAPLIFVFLFTVVDFGLALDRRITVQHAVREGARRAAVASSSSDAIDVTVDQSQGLLDAADVDVCYEDTDSNGNPSDAGDNVKVSATFEYEFTIPFTSIVNAMGGSLPSGITMTPSADMRMENTIFGGTACP